MGQQIMALLLVFHQTHNLSCNKFVCVAGQARGFCISYSTAFSQFESEMFDFWQYNSTFVTVATYWVPDLPEAKRISGHL